MRDVYGNDKVASVHMVKNQKKLEPLVAKYEKQKQKLEDMVDNYRLRMKRGKAVKPKMVRQRFGKPLMSDKSLQGDILIRRQCLQDEDCDGDLVGYIF